MTKLIALISDQGTAMSETCLCEECATPALKRSIQAFPSHDWNHGDWEDCTENDALSCVICGKEGHDD